MTLATRIRAFAVLTVLTSAVAHGDVASQFKRITGPLNSGYGTGTARQIQLMLRMNF